MATVEFGVMGKDMVSTGVQYFTAPAAQSASSVMASNRASLIIDGQPEVLVTSLSRKSTVGWRPVRQSVIFFPITLAPLLQSSKA